MAMEHSPNVCYICFSPTTHCSDCACVDRYVHRSCLIKFHTQRHNIHCTICRSPIGGMSIENKVVARPNTRAALIFVSAFVIIVFSPIAVYLLVTKYFWNFALALALVMLALAVSASVLCLRGLYQWRVYRRPLLERRVATRVVAVRAPVAETEGGTSSGV